jgi:hypothetical protein
MKITDLLDEHHIQYKTAGQHHHVCDGWVGIDCPMCSPGAGKYKLGFNLTSRTFTCWSCGVQDRVEILEALTDLSRKEAARLFGQLEGQSGPRKIKPRGTLTPPKGVSGLHPSHERYLKSRGFDPGELVRLWGLQGIAQAPRLSWHLYIPIIYQGVELSWTTRKITETGKYHNAKPDEEAYPAKSLLYGEDYCRHTVIICEGPADVWRVGPGAVATMGVLFTKAQLAKLAKYPRRAICFDSDRAGRERASRMSDALCPFDGNTFVVTLDASDPGSAKDSEIKRLRKWLFKER